MRTFRFLLGGMLLLLMGVSVSTAQTVKVEGYKPTKRVTQLEPGKTYMIYNSCWNGTQDRTGFIGSSASGSGFSHTGDTHPKPVYFVGNKSHLWTVEAAGDIVSGYYLKSVKRNQYVSATGAYSDNSTATNVIYIQDWQSSQCPKPSVNSENHNGTTTAAASITANSGVWTICGTSVSSNGRSKENGDCWNGNPTTWAKWESSHPFAFYEYEIVEAELPGYPEPGKQYFIYCDNGSVTDGVTTEKPQYFFNNNGTLTISNTAPTTDDENYIFICLYDKETGYYQFQNVADKSKYIGYQAMSSTPYNYRLEDGSVSGTNIHLYAVNNSKYIVMINSTNRFDQSNNATYTKSDNDDYSADFIFVKSFQQQITDLIAEAEALLEKSGVGYPVSTADSRTTLRNAITAASNEGTAINDRITALTNAIKAYKASTTDIQLPESGKAYTISSVNWNGLKRYLVYKGSGMEFVSIDPQEATPFICREISPGVYTFVNNDGKYLVWCGSSDGTNSHKGYVNSYSHSDGNYTAWTQLTVKKLVKGSYMDKDQEHFFGNVAIQGRRSNNTGFLTAYFIMTTAGAFDQSSKPYFQTGYTSALFMEEAAYPNNVTLNTISNDDPLITGIERGNTIGSFSAPFSTVIPENVTAYIGQQTENGVQMTPLTEGTALPANQGVILIGTSETTKALMVPATTETLASTTGNVFSNSAGTPHVLVAGDYILGRGSQGIGLYQGTGTLPMNKAYWHNTESNTRGLSLIFNGETTGVTSIQPADANQAPIYDLTGRRVSQLQKGGIYISKGRKFIVK